MTQRRALVRLLWVLGIAVLTAAYAYVGQWIFADGYFSPATKFVAERAYVGIHSASPFENLALVYPPVPIIIYAILWPPVVASVVLSVIATMLAVWTAVRYTNDRLSALLTTLAMLTPAVALTALADATAWIFAAMLTRAMYLLARYTEREYSVYLFQAGLIIAIGIFIDLRMAAFAFSVSLALFFNYARREFWQGVSVALVLVFPVFFFFIGWNFVQWVFTGHLGFLLPPLIWRPANEAWPAAAAYIVSLVLVAISPRGEHRRYLLAICLAPAVILVLSSATGLTLGAGEFALIGLACTIVAITQIGNVWLRRVGAAVLLASSIVLRFTLPPLATEMLNLSGSAVIGPPTITHYTWEGWVTAMRIILAVILAILTILLARHSLAKLTGEAQTS
ncbi:MAG TPA: hypothetical protein VF741_08010 [Candidatus Aquilonibacter sp.]